MCIADLGNPTFQIDHLRIAFAQKAVNGTNDQRYRTRAEMLLKFSANETIYFSQANVALELARTLNRNVLGKRHCIARRSKSTVVSTHGYART
jgi:hypothetical protein